MADSPAIEAMREYGKRNMGLSYPKGHWDKDRVYFVLEEVLPCCTDEIRADSHRHMSHAGCLEHLAVKFGTTPDEIQAEIFKSLRP